jgi:hypothetical protein
MPAAAVRSRPGEAFAQRFQHQIRTIDFEAVTGATPSDSNSEQIRFFTYLQFRRAEMAVKRLKYVYGSLEAKVFGDEAPAPPKPSSYELNMASLLMCMKTIESLQDLKLRTIMNES